MILCPKCKTRTNVYDSRISFDGETRRKRLCPSCAYRFATVEVLDPGRPLVHRVKKQREEVKAKLAKRPKKSPTPKPKAEKKKERERDDADYYESTLDEDFYEVARDLGIGGLDEYE